MPRAEAIATFSFEDGRRPLPELISSLISKLKEIYKLRNIETEQSIELEKGMGSKPDWLPYWLPCGPIIHDIISVIFGKRYFTLLAEEVILAIWLLRAV